MRRNFNVVAAIVLVILVMLMILVLFAGSTANCPSVFFCSPDPAALFAGILFVLTVLGARLVSNLAGGGSKSEPPPND